MSILEKIIANPGAFSIEMLEKGMNDGMIPGYIAVPLIQQKIDQRKQMQMEQAGQGAQPNQMPIAEEVLSQARGVNELQSELPAQYASGGIVAFDEGGPVEHYQNQGRIRPTWEDAPYRGFFGTSDTTSEGQEVDPSAYEFGVPLLGGPQPRGVTRTLAPASENVPAAPSTAPTPTPTTETPKKFGLDTLFSSLGIGGTQPDFGKGIGGTGLGIGSSRVPAPPSTTALRDATQRMMYGDQFGDMGYLGRAEARDRELQRRIDEAEGKVTGKAYEGLEKSLEKEAKQFGADKEDAKNMAMLKAGLAMMAGTSRHALENIGKGAMSGVEDYKEAAKDIKRAQKENERMKANIEQARRAESMGDRDRAIARATQAIDAKDRRDQFGVNAVIQATGTDTTNATHIWSTQYAGEKTLQGALISARSHLAAQDLAGRWDVAKAIIAAQAKEPITRAQMATLYKDAEKMYPRDTARAEVLKSLNLSKAPTNDPEFERRVDMRHKQVLDIAVGTWLGSAGATTGAPTAQGQYSGFKLIP